MECSKDYKELVQFLKKKKLYAEYIYAIGLVTRNVYRLEPGKTPIILIHDADKLRHIFFGGIDRIDKNGIFLGLDRLYSTLRYIRDMGFNVKECNWLQIGWEFLHGKNSKKMVTENGNAFWSVVFEDASSITTSGTYCPQTARTCSERRHRRNCENEDNIQWFDRFNGRESRWRRRR